MLICLLLFYLNFSLGGRSINYIALSNPLSIEYFEFLNCDHKTLDKALAYSNVKTLICNQVCDENFKLTNPSKIIGLINKLSKLEELHFHFGSTFNDLNLQFNTSYNSKFTNEVRCKILDCFYSIYSTCLATLLKTTSELRKAMKTGERSLKEARISQLDKLKIFIIGVRVNGERKFDLNFREEFKIQEPILNLHLKYNEPSDQINSIIKIDYNTLSNHYTDDHSLLHKLISTSYPNLQIVTLNKPSDNESLPPSVFQAFLASCNNLISLNIHNLKFKNNRDLKQFYAQLPSMPSLKTLKQFAFYDHLIYSWILNEKFLFQFEYLHYFQTNLGDSSSSIANIIKRFKTDSELIFGVKSQSKAFNLIVWKNKSNSSDILNLKIEIEDKSKNKIYEKTQSFVTSNMKNEIDRFKKLINEYDGFKLNRQTV